MTKHRTKTVYWKQLSERLASQYWVSKTFSKEFIDSLMYEIEYELFQGHNVAFRDMFSLRTSNIKWKLMYNSKFKKKLPIDAHRWLRCEFSKNLHEKLKLFDKNSNIWKK